MRLLSVEELEQVSGVSRFTWRTWLREKRVPYVRLGRLIKVREEDYERFVAENRQEAEAR